MSQRRRLLRFSRSESPSFCEHGEKAILCDNDSKFGAALASTANAACERFLGSVRRESLDHLLIVTDGQLYRMIKEYVALFNLARPQQGSAEQIPERMGIEREEKREGKILYFPVLNGLHHDYRRAA